MSERATIYFIYQEEPAARRETTVKTAKEDIRYWLGKSPGIYQIEEILVVPDTAKGDWTKVISEIAIEQANFEADQREQRERREFERLKAKYDSKETNPIKL
jgi:hypothetical protein